MGQRLSRAKAKIAAAGIPFSVPEPPEWQARLDAVLAVVYLIFNAGYTAGPSAGRDLAEEAIWLGDSSTGCARRSEIEGFLALMLLTHARRAARVDQNGATVPLADRIAAYGTARPSPVAYRSSNGRSRVGGSVPTRSRLRSPPAIARARRRTGHRSPRSMARCSSTSLPQSSGSTTPLPSPRPAPFPKASRPSRPLPRNSPTISPGTLRMRNCSCGLDGSRKRRRPTHELSSLRLLVRTPPSSRYGAANLQWNERSEAPPLNGPARPKGLRRSIRDWVRVRRRTISQQPPVHAGSSVLGIDAGIR